MQKTIKIRKRRKRQNTVSGAQLYAAGVIFCAVTVCVLCAVALLCLYIYENLPKIILHAG